MSKGYGQSANKRSDFKHPSYQFAADHFSLTPLAGSAPVTLYANDFLATAGDFSSFTIATNPKGPFTASLDFTTAGTSTVYVKGASPYQLILSTTATIS